VVVARDGAEAVDYLFATGRYEGRDPSVMPRVVLLDLGLPKLDGLRLTSDDSLGRSMGVRGVRPSVASARVRTLVAGGRDIRAASAREVDEPAAQLRHDFGAEVLITVQDRI
jgi:hypothetical protein